MAVEHRGPRDIAWGLKVYGWLESELLTEENTDVLADTLAKYVPIVPSFIARKLLDAALPGLALKAVREIMQKLGWLPDSDRYVESPFRKAVT